VSLQVPYCRVQGSTKLSDNKTWCSFLLFLVWLVNLAPIFSLFGWSTWIQYLRFRVSITFLTSLLYQNENVGCTEDLLISWRFSKLTRNDLGESRVWLSCAIATEEVWFYVHSDLRVIQDDVNICLETTESPEGLQDPMEGAACKYTKINFSGVVWSFAGPWSDSQFPDISKVVTYTFHTYIYIYIYICMYIYLSIYPSICIYNENGRTCHSGI
jgi:hypothetical protein